MARQPLKSDMVDRERGWRWATIVNQSVSLSCLCRDHKTMCWTTKILSYPACRTGPKITSVDAIAAIAAAAAAAECTKLDPPFGHLDQSRVASAAILGPNFFHPSRLLAHGYICIRFTLQVYVSRDSHHGEFVQTSSMCLE
jgi:hypothetical protein